MRACGVNSEGAVLRTIGWSSVVDEPATSQVIAEDTLALLDAFVDQDMDEVEFRIALLSHYAERSGWTSFKAAAESLVVQLRQRRRGGDQGALARALEDLVGAAALAVLSMQPAGDEHHASID